ncbi:hypothetical protein H257_04462 [Aphanomyces astaci]|uniref:Uncharacterized protein n=1 Tax=Aphanomyces astaci TaxID=112090 RepID=W4GVV5_APHAT|nr:hypothetical protein H257_04462 [Aphanomyces astaci]ETV83855.1 hypothetical protein H257_04462 [Aphanomyces astaci]|eukprot:XP_009827285.1 hypothetical protein H257_04462 [Aphanomyces astaci]
MEELHEWGTRLELLDDIQEKDIVFKDILGAIQVPGASDGAKSLAAQLVSKHVANFPHHEDATIDALVSLSQLGEGKQSQSVRIHAILGLVMFMKGQTIISLALHEKLSRFVNMTLARETSGVLVRHLTSLHKLLGPTPNVSIPKSTNPVTAAPPSPAKVDSKQDFIPPSPFVFVKGFQRSSDADRLLAYFQVIDPSLSRDTVHLHNLNRTHQNVFIDSSSIDKAREIIQYASTHPFQGRTLTAQFARGPAVTSVVFHAADSYPTDWTDLESMWPDVTAELRRRFPKAQFVTTSIGKATFESLDTVKTLVTKGLTVRGGRKICVVYDSDEQTVVAHEKRTKQPSHTTLDNKVQKQGERAKHTPYRPPATPSSGATESAEAAAASNAACTAASPLVATNDNVSPRTSSCQGVLLPSPSKYTDPSQEGPLKDPSPPRLYNSPRRTNNHTTPDVRNQNDRARDAPRTNSRSRDRRPLLPPPVDSDKRQPVSLGEIARAGGSDRYNDTLHQRRGLREDERVNRLAPRDLERRTSRDRGPPVSNRPQTIGEMARAGGGSLLDRRSRSRDRRPPPSSRPQPTLGDIARSGGGSLSCRPRSRDRGPPVSNRPQTIGEMARAGGGSLLDRRSRSRARAPRSPPPSGRQSQPTIGDIARAGGGDVSSRSCFADAPRRQSSSSADRHSTHHSTGYTDSLSAAGRTAPYASTSDRPRTQDTRSALPNQDRSATGGSRTLGEIARSGGGSLGTVRSRSRGRPDHREPRRSRSRRRPDNPPQASSEPVPAGRGSSRWEAKERNTPSKPAKDSDEGGNLPSSSGGAAATTSRSTGDNAQVKRKECAYAHDRNQRPRHNDDNDVTGRPPASSDFYTGRPHVDYSSAVTSRDDSFRRADRLDQGSKSSPARSRHQLSSSNDREAPAERLAASADRSTPERPVMARTIEMLQDKKDGGGDGGHYTPDSDTGSLQLRDILNPARHSQYEVDECEVDYSDDD